MKKVEELRKSLRLGCIPLGVLERIDKEINEKYETTVQKKDVSSFLRSGWTGADTLDLFKLPSQTPDLKGLKQLRLIGTPSGEVYFWDSRVLHYVISGLLGTSSVANMLYKVGSNKIELHEARQSLDLFKRNYKTPGSPQYIVTQKVKKSFPKVKYFSTPEGDLPV